MNDNGAPARDAAANSPADHVTGGRGPGATFAEIDVRLEVRNRIASAIDEIDAGDAPLAAANLALVLCDLDGLA